MRSGYFTNGNQSGKWTTYDKKVLPYISNSVGPVKILLSALLRSTPLSVSFIRFVARRIDDHGSFGNLSVGFSPTQRSLRS